MEAVAGPVTVILISLSTVKCAALIVPKFTVVAPVKPVPEIVTVVPPVNEPLTGSTLVMDGVPVICTAPASIVAPGVDGRGAPR